MLTKSDEKTEKLINYEDHKTEIVSEHSDATVRQRKTKKFEEGDVPRESVPLQLSQHPTQVRKLMLLVIAITIHNFPEGLAVGVGYASVGRPGNIFYIRIISKLYQHNIIIEITRIQV